MEHGETRNHRTETETNYAKYTTPNGPVTLPTFSITQTVSERWCQECNAWVTAKGIMGGLLCPMCHTPWKEIQTMTPKQAIDQLTIPARVALMYLDHPGKNVRNTKKNAPYIQELVTLGLAQVLDNGQVLETKQGAHALWFLIDNDPEANKFYFKINM